MEDQAAAGAEHPGYVLVHDPDPADTVKSSTSTIIKTITKFVLVMLLVAGFAVVFSFYHDTKSIEHLLEWIDKHRTYGLLVFSGVYLIGTVLLVPVAILAVAAGALFGLPLGATIVWFSALLGETVAFVIGRFLLRDFVAEKARHHELWSALEAAIQEEGWKIVLLLRLAPIIPFALLNYVLGTTAVPFPQFFMASALGIIPGLIVYVYLGTLAAGISDISKAHHRAPKAVRIAMIVCSIVACIVAIVGSTIVARRALMKRLRPHVADRYTPASFNDMEQPFLEAAGDTSAVPIEEYQTTDAAGVMEAPAAEASAEPHNALSSSGAEAGPAHDGCSSTDARIPYDDMPRGLNRIPWNERPEYGAAWSFREGGRQRRSFAEFFPAAQGVDPHVEAAAILPPVHMATAAHSSPAVAATPLAAPAANSHVVQAAIQEAVNSPAASSPISEAYMSPAAEPAIPQTQEAQAEEPPTPQPQEGGHAPAWSRSDSRRRSIGEIIPAPPGGKPSDATVTLTAVAKALDSEGCSGTAAQEHRHVAAGAKPQISVCAHAGLGAGMLVEQTAWQPPVPLKQSEPVAIPVVFPAADMLHMDGALDRFGHPTDSITAMLLRAGVPAHRAIPTTSPVAGMGPRVNVSRVVPNISQTPGVVHLGGLSAMLAFAGPNDGMRPGPGASAGAHPISTPSSWGSE